MQDYDFRFFSKLKQLPVFVPGAVRSQMHSIIIYFLHSLREAISSNFKCTLLWIPQDATWSPLVQRQLPFLQNHERNPEFATRPITTMGNPTM